MGIYEIPPLIHFDCESRKDELPNQIFFFFNFKKIRVLIRT